MKSAQWLRYIIFNTAAPVVRQKRTESASDYCLTRFLCGTSEVTLGGADKSAGRQNMTPSLWYITCFQHPSGSSSLPLPVKALHILNMRVSLYVLHTETQTTKWEPFWQSGGAILTPPTTHKGTVWGSRRDLKVEFRMRGWEMLYVCVYVHKDNMRVRVYVCVCVCNSVTGYPCPYFTHTFVGVKTFSLKPPRAPQWLLSTSQSICYLFCRKSMKCDWLLCSKIWLVQGSLRRI